MTGEEGEEEGEGEDAKKNGRKKRDQFYRSQVLPCFICVYSLKDSFDGWEQHGIDLARSFSFSVIAGYAVQSTSVLPDMAMTTHCYTLVTLLHLPLREYDKVAGRIHYLPQK